MLKKLAASILFIIIIVNIAHVGAQAPTLFDDEFNGTSLDQSAWIVLDRYGDVYNHDMQCFKPSAVTVANGYLSLTSSQVTATCPNPPTNGGDPTVMQAYTAGAVMWRNFNYTYGHLAFAASMPGASGAFPAIWLLGSGDQPYYAADPNDPYPPFWPNPGADEIDVAEFLNHDLSHVNEQIHTVGSNQGCQPNLYIVDATYMHQYWLDWSPGLLVFGIDGEARCTISGAQVSSTPKFLLITNPVNATFGGAAIGPWPSTMQVDYIRVTGTSQPTPTPLPSSTPTLVPTIIPTAIPTNTPSPVATATVVAPTATRSPTAVFPTSTPSAMRRQCTLRWGNNTIEDYGQLTQAECAARGQ